MAFVHKRGQGYPWDALVVIWNPSACLALYGGHFGAIDGYALMMPSVVIANILIWFFWMASFKVCIDSHPTSCYNIIASSAPLIYCRLKHAFLVSTVLCIFSLWFLLLQNPYLLCQNNIDLPHIALIFFLCHCEGVR